MTARVTQHSADVSGGSHVYAVLSCHIHVTFSFTYGGDVYQLHLHLQRICIYFFNCYLVITSYRTVCILYLVVFCSTVDGPARLFAWHYLL